jgi:hypothetical protein
MDKKLLDSLNNLSVALENIADILNKKQSGSATGAALESGDFGKDLKAISVGIKSIKADTEEILKGQKTILELSKKKSDKKTPMEEAGGDKKKESNLKKGVGTIILIAVAVLAIGMAFKLVGSIDFVSVIGLGLAIVVIAVAFEKIAKLDMTLKQAAIASAAMVMMSIAVMLSSWALGMIRPIGFAQAITGILIAGLFTVLSYGLPKIVKAIDNIKNPVKTGIYLVLILPAIGLGIAMASWALSLIKPIGFAQAITGILIAGLFTVISFGIVKIVKAIDKIKNPVKTSLLLVLMLPAIALAITASSYILSLVNPISFGQAITSILIAALFVVISFGIEKIVKALGKMQWSDVAKLPVFFTLIAAAIAASAFIFSTAAPYFSEITFMMMLKVLILGVAMGVVLVIVAFAMKIMGNLKWGDVIKVPALFTLLSLAIAASAFIIFNASGYINGISFMTMFKLLIFSVVIAIAVAVTAIAMKIVNILGSIMDYVKGGIAILIIATTIMVASQILKYGSYEKYPDWKWSLGVGMSLVAFGLAAVVLGSIAMSGFGALAILAGAAMILVVAATVVATSKILNKGSYDKFPPLLWALGTTAVMLPFGMAAVALGMISISGIGAIAIAAGLLAILLIAETVVSTSKILNKGKYSGGPSYDWTLSTGLVMTGFGLAVLTLGTFIVGTLGLGWIALEAGAAAVDLVAESIVSASKILQKGKYSGGPTKEWAEGISISLGAFSPIYGMLMMSGIFSLFGGGGVSPDDFAAAIETVSEGIVTAAGFFADNKSAFVNGPAKEWAEGVGTAIGAFAPVFQVLQDSAPGLFSSGGPTVEDMSRAIMTISSGIVDAAKFFADPEISKLFNTEGSYPSKKWGEGVGAALNAFAPVFKSMSEDSGWFTSGDDVVDGMVRAVSHISRAMVNAAITFTSLDPSAWGAYPTTSWGKGVGASVDSFLEVVDAVSGVSIFDTINLRSVMVDMVGIAKLLYRSQKFFSFSISDDFVAKISKNVLGYAELTKQLEKALTITEKKTISLGFLGDVSITTKRAADTSTINKVVNQMVMTAGILYKNRRFFDNKIDPDFMKSVSSNVMDYARLAKSLALDSDSSALDELLGVDPISRAAKGMVKIASAYDKLASAIKGFSGALNGLDGGKVNMFRSLTGNLALLSAMDSNMFSNMLKVLESRSGVFANMLKQQAQSEGVGKGGVKGPGGKGGGVIQSTKGGSGQPKDSKGETQLQKLDKIIVLLSSMNKTVGSGSLLDNYLQSVASDTGSSEIGKEK